MLYSLAKKIIDVAIRFLSFEQTIIILFLKTVLEQVSGGRSPESCSDSILF